MLRPMGIFLIFELLLILHLAQSQTYLECKFDQDTPTCTLNPVGTSPPLDVNSFIIVDDSSIDPIMPLSDVTSITTLTIGNESPCELPYQLDGSSTDIYFCTKIQGSSNLPTCATVDTSMQECEVGQYVVSELAPAESQTYYIEITGTRDPSCLSFYYYITRSNVSQIVVRIGDILGSETQEIGQASAVPYNGWHPIEFSFAPTISNYRIYFDLQRSEASNEPVYVALDEIMIIDGRCDAVNTTTTKTDQTTQTNAQETSTTTTVASSSTTINLVTTESTTVQGSTNTAVSNVSTTFTTTPIPLSSEAWSGSSFSSQWETSEKTATTSISPITSTTAAVSTTTTPSQNASTTTSTIQPISALFRCDFTTYFCFERNELVITNGSEFNPINLSGSSKPPRAPTSDITSISKPTSNNEVCKLPFRPSLNNSGDTTDWDMWFCYNNKCPTQSEQLATCASGAYGLIALASSEQNRTITHSLERNDMIRDSAGEQCLRFYYYFTVDDQLDLGQQIQVWIRPNNQTENQFSIGTLTVNDMKDNEWNFRDTTFKSTFVKYTLAFHFEVTVVNRTRNPQLNKTIYFALDNIELYDYNCSYVNATPTVLPVVSTTTPFAQSSTTVTEQVTATSPSKSKLPVQLGLSIGLGIPLAICIILFLIYTFKRKKRPRGDNSFESKAYIPMK